MNTALSIYEYDGVLGLVDINAYQPEVEWTVIDPDLIDHFTAEQDAKHAFVWQTSMLGGGEFEVRFTDSATDATSFRELTGTLEVTAGKLYLVNYTDLTMASENSTELPTKWGADWFVDLANGTYAVTVRQLFDPETDVQAEDEVSFEIVLTPGAHETSPPEQLFWR